MQSTKITKHQLASLNDEMKLPRAPQPLAQEQILMHWCFPCYFFFVKNFAGVPKTQFTSWYLLYNTFFFFVFYAKSAAKTSSDEKK